MRNEAVCLSVINCTFMIIVISVATMSYYVVFLLILARPGSQISMNERFVRFNERSCEKLLQKPNYREEVVVGQAWREYYSWRSFSKKCHVTEFKEATPKIINRFKNDMTEYMLEQPNWEDATLLVKNGKHEMLMLQNISTPGRYKAIPNLSRFGDFYAFARHQIRFQSFAMKLLRNDKFLVMLDCRDGMGLLMCRANDTVDENEVLSVAEDVGIGKGYIGCTSFLKSNYGNDH